MKKKERKTPATVRVHNIVLTYDTAKPDNELEGFSVELLHEINQYLKSFLSSELPQFSITTTDKQKLKISVIPYEEDEEY